MTAPILHRPGTTSVHRLPAHIKLVATGVAVLGLVATPRTAFWAFGVFALVLGVVWALARIPPGWAARRAVIEGPFVLLAGVLPFTGAGPYTGVLGVPVSVEGALAGWNIVVKGTFGVLVSLTLAATTHPGDIVMGLRRLRLPGSVTMIAGLVLRYVEVLVREVRRMHRARVARGDDPRFLWQVAATARGIGVLFLRSYERGERVHLAMRARGWTGSPMPAAPTGADPEAGFARWAAGLAPAAVVAGTCGVAIWTT